MTILNVATVAVLAVVVLAVGAVAFLALCGTSGKEPTADYMPCGRLWSTTDCCSFGGDHRCDRIPGGHRRHHCVCGAEDEPGPLLTVVDEDTQELHVDEPVARIYTEPGWTHFRGGLVHIDCVAKALDDIPPCAGCAVHLDHVLTGAA